MRWILSLIALVLTSCNALASDPINAARLIYGGTWENKVGVSNGIPTTYTQSGGTISAYTGTAGTINTAISGAADNTFVQLGAGTFTLSSSIVINNSKTILRGTTNANGVPTTTITFSGASTPLIGMASGTGWDLSDTNSFTNRGVTSPAAASLRGSSTVTLNAAPTGMTVGQVFFFSDKNQPGDDFYGYGSSGANRAWMHWARCLAISGSDITFEPAINADFLTGPVWCSYKAGGGMLQLCGVEDLIVTSGAGAQQMLEFRAADSCWIKNVNAGPTSGGGSVHHINCYMMFRCEVRHCELHGQTAYGNSAYAINAYGGGSFLVIDNYFHDLSNIMPMFGLHCSAFAYNYANAFSYDSPNGWLSQIVFDHGAFDDYNLFEGNWIPQSYNDDAAGSQNIVWLRNRMRSKDDDGATGAATDNTECMSMEAGHTNRVMVGNILGDNGFATTIFNTFSGVSDFPSHAIYNCYINTTNTFIRKANYNTVTDGVPTDEALAGGEVVATSYLFSSQPVFAHYWPLMEPVQFVSFSGKNDATNLVAAAFRSVSSGAEPPWPSTGGGGGATDSTTTRNASGNIVIRGPARF